MIALNLHVFVDGHARPMRDWILEAMSFKLRHFCAAVGILAKYEAGTLCAQDCVGTAGRVNVFIKDDPQYGPQNSVRDYVVPETAKEPAFTPAAVSAKPAAVIGAQSYDDPNSPPF
jgi:hypothetical protein